MRSFPVKSPSRERVLRADFSKFFFSSSCLDFCRPAFPGISNRGVGGGRVQQRGGNSVVDRAGARKERALRIPLPPVTEGGTPASGRAWAGLAGSESKRTRQRERRRGRRPGRCGDGKTETDRQTEKEREREERESVCRCARVCDESNRIESRGCEREERRAKFRRIPVSRHQQCL